MTRAHLDRPTGPPIDLRISRNEQLFDILDPAPFWDKDLDADAADFIELSYREAPPPKPVEIRIRIGTTFGPEDEAVIQRAVAAHFERRRAAERLRLKEHNRRSRILVLAAFLVMGVCLSARELLVRWLGEGDVPVVLDEGLIVLGWVALWRPLEELLFEWHPRWRRVKLYGELAQLKVCLQADVKA
jgi:hypothetical protein